MLRSRFVTATLLLAGLALVLAPDAALAKKKKKRVRPAPPVEHCVDGGIKIDRPGPQEFRCFEGEVVTGICVKAGTETWGVGTGDGGDGPGCYSFSELGGSAGSVSGGGTGPECKDISYTSFYCEPGEPPVPVCGDGIIEGEEQCDPPGRINEGLVCNEACRLVEIPEPEPEPVCGNGVVEAGETCDPPGLLGEGLGCTESCQIVEVPGEGGENGEGGEGGEL
jgi:cysteine-rich repeat protein